MLDHLYESPEEERERETADAWAEHSLFEHHRGDDRVEPQPFSEEVASEPRSATAKGSLRSTAASSLNTPSPDVRMHVDLLAAPRSFPLAAAASESTERQAT